MGGWRNLAYAQRLERCPERVVGSSPTPPTKTIFSSSREKLRELPEVLCWLNECKFE